MSNKSTPNIVNYTKDEFTKISFVPDLSKFGMEKMDDDLVALFTKRVYDMAGCVRDIKVFLNGERIKIRNFKQYVELFVNKNEQVQQAAATAGQTTPPLIHSIINDRWEICFTLSDGQFNQVSFVNGINTYKGGTHVSHVADQIVSELVDAVKKKNKAAPVKPFQVKSHMFIFINCLIENPTFDSQTKENMTLRTSAFGSKCEIGEDFIKRVLKSGVLENILSWAKFKQEQLLKKTDGAKKSRLSGITKLDDANNAGTRNASKCTLILTEGDSAKALAVSGLSVIGRDNWGVFPLRGKLLNVREASHKQIMDNAEINHIKQILGLQHGKVYESSESLRYGRLMIMTDQDHDGSHIKGLLINMLDHFWPSLLKVPGFLVEFITPIVKCTRGRQEESFFTIPEYERWKEANNDGHGWTIKYYKGLGTSTAADAKKYFSDLCTHLKPFQSGTDEDRALIDLAFNKKKADDRKEWLRGYIPGTHLDHTAQSISLRDFINRELILFSMADNCRSIPSLVDGLKPGQRKIMFACFKRKLKAEIKVAQLAGYIAEHSAYHHGEQSLCSTIVGLAQNFVGSNNVNLLEPNGQFGTRLQGGKDAASARYIFTALSPLARMLFRIEDDPLLKQLVDDGQSIEPEWYCPILPMVLVNGGEGIGTGWSTFVPNYNPVDIVNCLLNFIDDVEQRQSGSAMEVDGDANLVSATVIDSWRERLHPWYRGFTGEIERIASDKYRINGTWRKIDNETLEITELPIGTWTQSYKEMLEGMLTGSSGTASASNEDVNEEATRQRQPAPFIRDYREYHTDTTVRFLVTLSATNMAAAESEGIAKKFKLTSTLTTSNLVCFDALGRLKKYTHPLELLLEFFPLRWQLYQRRKAHLVEELTRDWQKLENRVRFIEEIASGKLKIQNKKKSQLVVELLNVGYRGFDEDSAPRSNGDDSMEATEDTSIASVSKRFDYLLNMAIGTLTLERAQALKRECSQKESELNSLLAKTPCDLWRADLMEFCKTWEANEKAALIQSSRAVEGVAEKKPAGSSGKKGKKVADADYDERKPVAPKSAKTKKATSSSDVGVRAFSTAAMTTPSGPQGSLDSFLSFKVSSASVDKEEDEESLPLAERIQRMLAKKSSSAAEIASKSTGSSVASSASASPAPKRTKRTVATKRAVVIESDSDEETENYDAFDISDKEDFDEE